jgi:glycine dehydrogenase
MTNRFQDRHIGPGPADQAEMLAAVGATSLDQLVDETLPASIRLTRPLELPDPQSEAALLDRLRAIGKTNQRCRSHIGMGYYGCHTPSVILRNMVENPGWYTPYTPYQAEIAQGRLEALLNYQTMTTDLTGMEIANASLLDEATAAAEAMGMMHRLAARRGKRGSHALLVSDTCYPQVLDVLASHAEPQGIELRVTDVESASMGDDVFGALVQYPDGHGRVWDPSAFIARAHESNLLVAVGTDLLALTLLRPPGEMGADIAYGNAQRFGVPMGYGGPHAAFFATRNEFARELPGRIIGVSVDAHGQPAYRMALQTREQHIRREKAKSNICTAQALLANVAGMYAVYHGPGGLRAIAQRVHDLACSLAGRLRGQGHVLGGAPVFDTLKVELSTGQAAQLREAAVRAQRNFRYFDGGAVGISLDETCGEEDVEAVAGVFEEVAAGGSASASTSPGIPEALQRTSPFLTHEVFRSHHSESRMMRYLKRLERKDIGLDTSMIPLGSCTMKLNAATVMMPVTWPEFAGLHPFVPDDQAPGYRKIFDELSTALARITGFAAVSLQPNSGAQGEYAGLMVIRAYHRDRGDLERDVVLIPSSAHGTNPASAVMAGMKVKVVKCDAGGNIDVQDLAEKAAAAGDKLAALMVTYPSTHGVFEEEIVRVCEVVHEQGGQVYMDGANLNAQVGLTSPGVVGADVCHINLHKTFAIPHGGGGPGMGPIAVAEHLAPYLPSHSQVRTGGEKGIHAVSAAPWGSASVLLISHAYISLLGAGGLTEATRHAILNANYVKARLKGHYDVLFSGPRGRVAHEMIFDLRPFKSAADIVEIDVAKRLMDYGFHAPTVAWPVAGTMMIEPTESEDKAELDRFCDALIAIRGEIQEIIEGRADAEDNVLKNAPHTAAAVTADRWDHPYSREKAAYPAPFVKASKVWPAVGRIDNTYGDRHLVCSCAPTDAYSD